ncbi:MAG: PrgI family protein [Oscillospiraceae bacterium]|nr:PrgI family protein [Oscillospiraceae bacterium]
MAYVTVPKDLSEVKTKLIFNLTKRQLICFGIGAAIGIPAFFLLRSFTGTSPAAIVMVVIMLPFFLFAMYEKNGQPLEKVLRNIIQVCFLRPKQRPYETNNYYALLQRQEKLNEEVAQIVRPTRTLPQRQKTD